MSGKPSVAIVGAGRVGTALGILLRRKGYPIRGVVRRSFAGAKESVRLIGGGAPHTDPALGAQDADIVLIAVPDDVLQETAAVVRAGRSFRPGDLLVHTSGALPASVLLDSAESQSGSPGDRPGLLSMHPVQSIADPVLGAERLVGAYFGLEGDIHAVEAGERLVADIGGRPLKVAPGRKSLYHAAACVASNYLVTLIDVALGLYERAGIDREDALRAIEPLIAATAANAARLGVPEALTGPIDRGDAETVRSHLSAMEAFAKGSERDRIERIYRMLGLDTLGLARRKRGSVSPGHELIERMLQDRGHQRWSE